MTFLKKCFLWLKNTTFFKFRWAVWHKSTSWASQSAQIPTKSPLFSGRSQRSFLASLLMSSQDLDIPVSSSSLLLLCSDIQFYSKITFLTHVLPPAYVKRMFLLKTTTLLRLRSCLKSCFSSLVMSHVDIISDSTQRPPAFIPAQNILFQHQMEPELFPA